MTLQAPAWHPSYYYIMMATEHTEGYRPKTRRKEINDATYHHIPL